MTDQSYVHYLFIIDRSGSMQSIREDTEGGIYAFAEEHLKTSGGNKRTASLFQFDTEHDCILNFDPLEDVQSYILSPRGGTALLDAVGNAISLVGHSLKHMPEDERPGQVMVIIATDGQENSSREYKRAEIKKMIQHQQDKYNWKFTYVGANQDAFEEAKSIGIGWESTLNYSATPMGAGTVWAAASAGVSSGTAPTSRGVRYSTAQRDSVK